MQNYSLVKFSYYDKLKNVGSSRADRLWLEIEYIIGVIFPLSSSY